MRAERNCYTIESLEARRLLSSTPSLDWSSYLGGTDIDEGRAIAADARGNVWVAGSTFSAGWASGGFDTTFNGAIDAFVAKINADGSLAWSTYLGGSDNDLAAGIAVDADGNAWVTGSTSSSGWAIDGFDTTYGGAGDAFVAKIDADGTLAWSSYFGKSGNDAGYALAVDPSGNAWLTGDTTSSGLAIGGFDTTYNGGGDGFVAKINATGSLAWSSYLGGSNYDRGRAITTDAAGNGWLTGETSSAGWATGGFDTSYNGGPDDAFTAKIGANGNLAWSSYLGGAAGDDGYAIATDAYGSALITGETYSPGWATGGFDTSYNDNGLGDAFVAKIGANGDLAWSTYLGGTELDGGYGVAIDPGGNTWVTGYSEFYTSASGWAAGGFDTTYNGKEDAFVAKIAADGGLTWSSYLGGSDYDYGGYGIAIDPLGAAWIVGTTLSSGWVSGGFDTTYNGGSDDAFVAKVSDIPTTFGSSDLVVQDVSFPSTSIEHDQSLITSFVIHNQGTGWAGPSTARMRLSADQTLTLYDRPVDPLDVTVPAIIPGGSYHFSGTFTVPAGTPPGDYYVGVFADAFNVAGQSDITNDVGLSSTTITVTAPPGAIAPTITQQPQPLNLNRGDTGELSVSVSGLAPFTYDWYHGNSCISQSTTNKSTSSIQFTSAELNQTGDYYVVVGNAAGSATSDTVAVTVSGSLIPLIPGEPTLLPDPDRPFNSAWPTIVISHGWEPGGDLSKFEDPDDGDWMGAMRAHIRAEFSSVNILDYVWPGAFTSVTNFQFYGTAQGNVETAGRTLASLLEQKLGPAYAHGVQFIGHSLGSIANAYAVDQLTEDNSSIDVEQFTILDAPMTLRLPAGGLIGLGAIASELLLKSSGKLYTSNWFHNMLPASGPHAVEYVDNYYGTDDFLYDSGTNTLGIGGFGDIVSGADNFKLDEDHTGVHEYYDEHAGYRNTVIFSSPIQTWSDVPRPPTTFMSIISTIADAVNKPGWLTALGGAANVILNNALQAVPGMSLTASAASSRLALAEANSDPTAAQITLDLTIPSNATSLQFDYQLLQPPDGRWITVSFNDTPLLSIPTANISSTDFQHEVIPIALLAGQTGVLSVAINGDAPQQTQLALANFAFFDEAPPVVTTDAAPSQTNGGPSIGFSEAVDAARQLPTITNLDTMDILDSGQFTPVLDDDRTEITWKSSNGPLPNGNYRISIPASAISDLAGNALAANYTADFFVLAGDGDGNRTVNLLDFNILATNFGKTGMTFSQGNYDYSADGKINLLDFNVLATNFGKHVDPPTAPASAPSAIQTTSMGNESPGETFDFPQDSDNERLLDLVLN